MSLTGMWFNEGDAYPGIFFIREIRDSVTSEIFWIGHDLDFDRMNWAHVFHGKRTGNIIKGSWADIPKGKTNGAGRIELRVVKHNRLELVSSSGDGFGAAVWKGPFTMTSKVDATLPRASECHYVDALSTGKFLGNDKGVYYLRHCEDGLFWLAEHYRGYWANVFHGEFDGLKYDGSWSDVPCGQAKGNGTLRAVPNLYAEIHGTTILGMEFTETSGGYGGTKIIRRDANSLLDVTFDRLECRQKTSGPGNDDIYAIIFTGDVGFSIAQSSPSCGAVRTPLYAGDQDMTEKSERNPNMKVWSPIGPGRAMTSRPIRNYEDALILIGLFENDHNSVDTVFEKVDKACRDTFSRHFNCGDHLKLVKLLQAAMRRGHHEATSWMPFASADDLIDIDEVRFANSKIVRAHNGDRMREIKHLKGEGAHYEAEFHLRPALLL